MGAEPAICTARCHRNCSAGSHPLWVLADRSFGTPGTRPMARLQERIYDSGVVGESGAGVERSTAIVVFTDLVGSTELRSRLGEDAAEELRRHHDRLITGAV